MTFTATDEADSLSAQESSVERAFNRVEEVVQMSSSRVVLLSMVIAAWLAASITAMAASTQLLGLRTAVDQGGTTLYLRFRAPVQYTPAWMDPYTYALDLSGASSKLPSDDQPVRSPLVSTYRIVSYAGADGKPHLRLEVALKSEAKVEAQQSKGEVAVRVQELGFQPATNAVPLNPKRGTAIRAVQVAKLEGTGMLEVQIEGNGTFDYRTMQLSNPERLVVDIPNALNRIHQKQLPVNTGSLRSVRIGQLSSSPIVSRIVMDLDSKTPFDVRKEATGLVVTLGKEAASSAATKDAPSTQAPANAVAQEVSKPSLPPARLAPAVKAAPAKSEEVKASAPIAPNPRPVVSRASSPAATQEHPRSAPVRLASLEATPEPVDPKSASLIAENKAPALPKPTADLMPSGPTAASERTHDPIATVLAEPKAAPEPTVLLSQAAPAGAPSAPQTAAPQAGAPTQRPTYTGEPISVNLKDVDLKDFFRLIHEISGLNLVLDPTVTGTVTIVLDEVPWDQAMDIVMKNNGLGKEVEGNVVRIAKLSTLEAEEKQRRDLAVAVEAAQPTVTTTRTLSYAKAADLIPTLKRFLTSRGDLIADARTNTLIIRDIPDVIPQIDRLVRALDTKSLQVEIEARVVSASRSFARDIGTQLAASGLTGNVTLGGTGLVGTSPINRGVAPPLFIGAPPAPAVGGPAIFANLPQPLITNFPAQGATSGFTFLLTNGSTFALDSIITAAESRGIGKLLSRPKIITQNNVEATVKQGVRIPLQTTVNNTISVQYVDVVLRLTVTPQITADGTIFLKTDIENTSIDPGIATTPGQFGLDTQSANTSVLVSNGGTVFFGGVVQNINRVNQQQVPLLGSVPLLGNLFKRTQTTSTTNELLFFITPRIVQS